MAGAGPELEPKQKIIVVLTLIFFGVAAWQLYQIIWGDSGSSAPAPQAQQTVAPPAPIVPATSGAPQMATTPVTPVQPQPEQVQLPTPSEKTLAELQLSQQNQKAYLQLASQYQLAQMQKMLAETKAGIAKANLDSAKTTLEMSKVSKQYHSSRGVSQSASATSATASSLPVQISTAGEYEVAMVSYHHGNWYATLRSRDGNLMQVKNGSLLPNGARVVMINRNGVMVDQKGERISLPVPVSTTSS